MKITYLFRNSIVLIVSTIANFSYGQTSNKERILGTWNHSKIEFLRPMEDSTNMRKQSTGSMITFVDASRFVAKVKTPEGVKEIESGNYSVSDDGKWLSQSGTKAQIITLTDKALTLKVPNEFILYFQKEIFPK